MRFSVKATAVIAASLFALTGCGVSAESVVTITNAQTIALDATENPAPNVLWR